MTNKEHKENRKELQQHITEIATFIGNVRDSPLYRGASVEEQTMMSHSMAYATITQMREGFDMPRGK